MNTRFNIWAETVAVTALPHGWHNHWRNEDGTVHSQPCPAILLQEQRQESHSWDQTDTDGNVQRKSHTKDLEPPYETHAVFASTDPGFAGLYPVGDDGNYICTTGPGEPFPKPTEPT